MEAVPVMPKTLFDRDGKSLSLEDVVLVDTFAGPKIGVVKAGGDTLVQVETTNIRTFWVDPRRLERLPSQMKNVIAGGGTAQAAGHALALAQELSRELNTLEQRVSELEEMHDDVRKPLPPAENAIVKAQHETAEAYAVDHGKPIGG